MSELLPCPFCGGKAELIEGGPGNAYVRCTVCATCGNDSLPNPAIMRWNRRAARPTAPEAGKLSTEPDSHRTPQLEETLNVPHIVSEGSREHVVSYGLVESRTTIGGHFIADWCSEPFCRLNQHPIRACVRHGHDPADLCPLPRLKDWLSSDAGRTALEDKP